MPSSRADAAAVTELQQLVQRLLSHDAKVYDLFTGEQIASLEDFEAVAARVVGG